MMGKRAVERRQKNFELKFRRRGDVGRAIRKHTRSAALPATTSLSQHAGHVETASPLEEWKEKI